MDDNKERIQCVLCGHGQEDGFPPTPLMSKGNKYIQDPNYDLPRQVFERLYSDGLGVTLDWLGPLLGPFHSNRLSESPYIHRLCAIWCPKVYFDAEAGGFRSVGREIARGFHLKCSRCKRFGATLGCRHAYCPNTYHLVCARAECVEFDHKNYVITCNNHVGSDDVSSDESSNGNTRRSKCLKRKRP